MTRMLSSYSTGTGSDILFSEDTDFGQPANFKISEREETHPRRPSNHKECGYSSNGTPVTAIQQIRRAL